MVVEMLGHRQTLLPGSQGRERSRVRLMLGLVLWVLGGCATVPHSMVVGPKMADLSGSGRVEHRSACAYYLFGLIPIGGDASLDAVTSDLLSAENGGTLAYMTVDEQSSFFLVATSRCTNVKAVFIGQSDSPRSSNKAGGGRRGQGAVKVPEGGRGQGSPQEQEQNPWVQQRGNCDSEVFSEPSTAPLSELTRCVRLVAVYRMDIDQIQGGYRERLIVALRRVSEEAGDDGAETARYLLSRLQRGRPGGD